MLSVALIIIANGLLKELIDRLRPGEVITLGSKSFPSGHVLHAVLLQGVLWLLARPWLPRRRDQLALAAVFIVWVALVSFSRVYLQKHWPSDVLGAYLLGASTLWVISWAMPIALKGRRRSQHKQTIEEEAP